MVSTINNFATKEDKAVPKDVTNRSNYVIYIKENSYLMELFYITYGVIPFLSQFCEMSYQSGNNYEVDIDLIRTNLLVSKIVFMLNRLSYNIGL